MHVQPVDETVVPVAVPVVAHGVSLGPFVQTVSVVVVLSPPAESLVVSPLVVSSLLLPVFPLPELSLPGLLESSVPVVTAAAVVVVQG